MPRTLARLASTLPLLAAAFIPLHAHAACTGPTGKGGTVIFNAVTKTMQYCNDTNWINAGPSNPAAAQTGCVSPTGIAGGVIFNGALGTVQFCNGSSWVNTACPTDRQPGGSGCTSPTGKPGTIAFETNSKELQFCDSTKWVAMGWPCGVAAGGLFKVKPSDPVASHYFGYTVAIDGDTLVVGAASDSVRASEAGAAYVFVRSGNSWTQQAKLYASDAAASDVFGWSVDISSNTIVVGSVNDDDMGTNSGSAYVFVRSGTTWSQQAKLTASDGAANDVLGSKVTINSNTIVLGTYAKSSGAGAVYVYTRSGTSWSQQAKLTASDPSSNARFGYSMGLESNTLVVGAGGRDYNANDDSGAAYIFTRTGTTWTQRAILTPPSYPASGFMGRSVDISNNIVVAGAPGSGVAGKVYVFTGAGTSWTYQQTLSDPTTALDDKFGESVAIYNANTILVGAPEDDDVASNAGTAVLFRLSGGTWSQSQKILPPNGKVNDNFGLNVDLTAGLAAISIHGDDDNATNSGAAYVLSY